MVINRVLVVIFSSRGLEPLNDATPQSPSLADSWRPRHTPLLRVDLLAKDGVDGRTTAVIGGDVDATTDGDGVSRFTGFFLCRSRICSMISSCELSRKTLSCSVLWAANR
jgi:hypothetical protein